MSAQKHTPGPWAALNSTDVFSALGADSGDGCPADDTDGWQVADCSVGITFVDGQPTSLGLAVQKANARLIAAAPDLLATLEAFPGFCADCAEGDAWIEQVRSALNRARG